MRAKPVDAKWWAGDCSPTVCKSPPLAPTAHQTSAVLAPTAYQTHAPHLAPTVCQTPSFPRTNCCGSVCNPIWGIPGGGGEGAQLVGFGANSAMWVTGYRTILRVHLGLGCLNCWGSSATVREGRPNIRRALPNYSQMRPGFQWKLRKCLQVQRKFCGRQSTGLIFGGRDCTVCGYTNYGVCQQRFGVRQTSLYTNRAKLHMPAWSNGTNPGHQQAVGTQGRETMGSERGKQA